MMRKLALCSLIFAPAVYADTTVDKNGTYDCKTDPVVRIGHARGNFVFTGECKSIDVPMGKNKVTIESVELLHVDGGANTIAVGAVGTINVNGADNKITWKKAKSGDKPTLKGDLGKNTITQDK